jgi:hypothetical protein
MKYFIAVSALLLGILLGVAAFYCGYRAYEDITWGFVMLGLMLPAAVALLIAQAAFHAVKDW